MRKNRKAPRDVPGTFVIGDAPVGMVGSGNYNGGSRTQRLAKKRKSMSTRAEKELETILNELNNGVLKGEFEREWAFAGKWILDFFFHENRLGIEVDGSSHNLKMQKEKDLKKEQACVQFGVTLIRITNQEVFGDRKALIRKLREGYKEANRRMDQNKITE